MKSLGQLVVLVLLIGGAAFWLKTRSDTNAATAAQTEAPASPHSASNAKSSTSSNYKAFFEQHTKTLNITPIDGHAIGKSPNHTQLPHPAPIAAPQSSPGH